MIDARHRLVRSAVFLLGLWVAYVFAVLTPPGQEIDEWSLGFAGVVPLPDGLAGDLRTVLLLASLAAAVGAIGWTLVRRRFAPALTAGGVLIAVIVTSPLLRDVVLARPDYGIAPYPANTFPSGHVSATVAACAIVLALVRPRHRWVTACVVAAPAVVAVLSVVGQAHRLSDVLGGALLAGAAVCWLPGRPPLVVSTAALWRAGVLCIGLALITLLIFVQGDSVSSWLATIVFAGVSVAATAIVVVAAFAAPARRQELRDASSSGR